MSRTIIRRAPLNQNGVYQHHHEFNGWFSMTASICSYVLYRMKANIVNEVYDYGLPRIRERKSFPDYFWVDTYLKQHE